MFSQFQPLEWLAILATVADLGLTVWAVQAGLAREANPLLLMFHGKRAAYAWVALGVALHFAIRTLLAGSPERGFDPRRETVWAVIAAVRGAAAAWNIMELVKARGARRA